MIPDLEKKINILKSNQEACKIIGAWIDYESKLLENPYKWNKDDFAIEGLASLKSASILRRIGTQLIIQDNKGKKQLIYK